jgi:hypothetical protein
MFFPRLDQEGLDEIFRIGFRSTNAIHALIFMLKVPPEEITGQDKDSIKVFLEILEEARKGKEALRSMSVALGNYRFILTYCQLIGLIQEHSDETIEEAIDDLDKKRDDLVTIMKHVNGEINLQRDVLEEKVTGMRDFLSLVNHSYQSVFSANF